MCEYKEIDKEIVRVLIKSEVYKEFAKRYLKKEQIDEIPEEILKYFE